MIPASSHPLLQASSLLAWLEERRWKILAVTLPFVLLLHLLFGAITIRKSNLDWRPSDQFAENYLAAAARFDPLPARSDGVRHPLWSWTISRIFHEDREVTFFNRGKWLNTIFCLLFLGALGVGGTRWLDPLATLNLLLLASLGILLVRGVYFQPEPLYYIFFFLSGVLAFRILRGANWKWYGMFGLTTGLAFLAKPSLLPLLLAFAAAFALRLGLALLTRDPAWSLPGTLLKAALAGTIFGLLLVPLARFTTEAFGKPLFSYTKHWMWMDDFETEAYPFQVTHPGRWELEKIPPHDLPGPAWYFRRHTLEDALRRLTAGTIEVVRRFFFPEPKIRTEDFFWRKSARHWHQPLAHRGVYLIALMGLVGVLAWPVRREVGRCLQDPGWAGCAALVVLVAALYTGLYGWYYPVGKGDRFMGSLWIPAVTLTCLAAAGLTKLPGPRWRPTVYLLLHGLILLSLLVQTACMAWHFSQGQFLVTKN